MKRLLILILLFLFSCGDSHSSKQGWLFLVYMNGDNDLASSAIEDLEELKEVGSSEYVRIIVQIDLSGRTTKRIIVRKGAIEEISDLGELDMASAETLKDFLIWAKDNYPSDRTVLVLWNHGNGWDQHTPNAPSFRKSILCEIGGDNGSDFLPNYKVREAIESSGIKLDILGLDASIMGTLEALYEFRKTAPIIIASQEVGESHGWDYKEVLMRLNANPAVTPEVLSAIVVETYRDFLENYFYPQNPGYEKRHTISAIRTNYLEDLSEEVNSMAENLLIKMKDPATRHETIDLITSVRNTVQEIDYYNQPYVYVDLADLSERLLPESRIPQIISQATIKEYHGSARPGAHGISIVFFKLPEALLYGTYDANYRNFDPQTGTGNKGEFIMNFNWDEFLENYYLFAGLI
jgi:hypothetical protein